MGRDLKPRRIGRGEVEDICVGLGRNVSSRRRFCSRWKNALLTGQGVRLKAMPLQ